MCHLQCFQLFFRSRTHSFFLRIACIGVGLLLPGFATSARAMSVVPPMFSELVAEAEVIVRGTVTDVRAEEFESPQGIGIRTLVTLRVERTLKGTPGATLTLTQLGGTVGGRTLTVAGMPEFKVGERQIVFATGNGRVLCPLVGIGHGRYHLRTDSTTGREIVVRENGAPLTSFEEIALPLRATVGGRGLPRVQAALAATEFESQIAAMTAQPAAGLHQR